MLSLASWVARALHSATGLFVIAWLGLIAVAFIRAAGDALLSDQFLGCRQALPSVAVGAAIVAFGVPLGLLAPVWLRRFTLRCAFALAGLLAASMAVLSSAAGALLGVSWLLLLSWAVAERLLRVLLPLAPASPYHDRALFGAVLGLGLTSHLGLLLVATGLAYRWLLVGLLLLGSMWLAGDIWENLRCIFKSIWRGSEALAASERAWFTIPVASYLAFFSVLVFVQAIAPEIQFDSLSYHLTVPRIFIEHHRLIAVPWIMHSWLVAGTEMNYLVAMLLADQIAAKLTNFAFFVLAACLVHSFARRHLAPAAALPAAVLFVTTPLVAWEAATTYTDLPLACFSLATLAATLHWLRDRNHLGWLILSGLLAGFSTSTKLNAVLFVAPVAGAIVVMSLMRRAALRDRVMPVATFGVSALLVASPWPVVRFLQTGNPVFPFLNAIFKSPLWPAVNEWFNFARYGIGTGLPSIVQLPWAMTFDAIKFWEGSPPGVLGPSLLAVFLVIFNRRWTMPVALTTFTLTAFALAWAFSVQNLRFFLPGVPLICILIGSLLISQDESTRPLSRAGVLVCRGVVIVWMLTSLPLWLATYWRIPERIPYGVATGRESRSSYLSRTVASYEAYQRLNASQAPNDVYVVAVGDHFFLYANGKVESITTSRALKPLVQARTSDEVMSFVRQKGITHLVVNRWALPRSLEVIVLVQQTFLDAHAELEFARHNVELYRFFDINESQTPGAPPEELLANPGFEVADTRGIASWQPANAPGLDATSTQARSGKAAVKVGPNQVLYQAVPITADKTYRLSHFSRSASDDCKVRAQVNWVDHRGKVQGVTLAGWLCTPDWTQRQVAGTAPEGAVTAIVFANSQQGEAWLDDFSFTAVR